MANAATAWPAIWRGEGLCSGSWAAQTTTLLELGACLQVGTAALRLNMVAAIMLC